MYRGVLFVQRSDLERASADHARLLKLDPGLAAKLEAVIVSRVAHEGNEGLAAQYEQGVRLLPFKTATREIGTAQWHSMMPLCRGGAAAPERPGVA